VIGASLKHLLATKRVVFVGYSLRDEDFSRLYGFLRREMGEVLPRSYIVTLDPGINRATHPDSTVIYTSGEYFLEAIVDRFLEEGRIINPKITQAAARKLDAVYDAHATLDGIAMQEHPEVIYTHSYQDGLIHGFERFLAQYRTGEYSNPARISGVASAYDPIRRERLRAKRYWDVAYIDGYTNALVWLLVDDDDRDSLPLFYVFGAGDLITFDDYKEAAARASESHKASFRVARRMASRYRDQTLVLHHTPWLQ
jgi:hypothetical protein